VAESHATFGRRRFSDEMTKSQSATFPAMEQKLPEFVPFDSGKRFVHHGKHLKPIPTTRFKFTPQGAKKLSKYHRYATGRGQWVLHGCALGHHLVLSFSDLEVSCPASAGSR